MQSQDDGLLQARLLNGNSADQHLDWQAINRWTPETGLLWVHLDFTHQRAREWLSRESGLDPLVADALIADETRPRCVPLAGGLLLSLRGVNSNPGANPEDMVALRLFTDGHRIISTRRRKLLSVLDIAHALDEGQGPRSAGEWLSALTAGLVERMGGIVESMEDRLDATEEALLLESRQELRMELLGLRREAIMLRRYFNPQREALNRLTAEPADWLSANDRLHLREAGDKVTRHVEDLDAIRDRGVVASEELASRLAEQMNLRMYVLSLIAGLFLPLGFLTGLLGINVGGIPGADNPWGFAIVILLLTAIAVLQLWLFRRKRWI